MRRLSQETAVALVVSALGVAALAVDHLVGTEAEPDEEPGLADPGAFLASAAVTTALVILVFAVVVRRARGDPDEAARKAIVCSALAIPAVALVFLGLPFPLAGAGIALGLRGRKGRRRHLATAAVVIGMVVLAVISAGYIFALVA